MLICAMFFSVKFSGVGSYVGPPPPMTLISFRQGSRNVKRSDSPISSLGLSSPSYFALQEGFRGEVVES